MTADLFILDDKGRYITHNLSTPKYKQRKKMTARDRETERKDKEAQAGC